jgi:pimeloyl-ACP methyl ester carboxylesterase
VRYATLLLLAACGAPEFGERDQHFFLDHEGVSMPVWVTGNWQSGRILVVTHGGPGTTNAVYHQKESFQRLAEDVGIVYWEQRASGSSHGLRRERLTATQFVEDHGILFDVLEHRFPDARFTLMGHSWGGHFAPRYLLESGDQDRVEGLIEMNGSHDSSCVGWQDSVDDVLAHAADVLAGDPTRRERRYWEGAIDFYDEVWRCDHETNENNQIEPYQGRRVHLWHSLYIRESGGYDVDPDLVLNGADTTELLFGTQYDLYAVTQHSPLPLEEYYGVDLTPRLGEITVPTQVIWGRFDRITHWRHAEPAFEAYGADDKEIVWFENSGHNPWAEEQDRFYDAVTAFLDRVMP